METDRALKRAIKDKAGEFARALGVSSSMIYKWTEPHTDYTDSGAYNPLDRLIGIIEKSLALGTPADDAFAPVQCVAEHFGGTFIPPIKTAKSTAEITRELSRVMKEVSDVMRVSAKSLEDNNLSQKEKKEIVGESWEAVRQLIRYIMKVQASVK